MPRTSAVLFVATAGAEFIIYYKPIYAPQLYTFRRHYVKFSAPNTVTHRFSTVETSLRGILMPENVFIV